MEEHRYSVVESNAIFARFLLILFQFEERRRRRRRKFSKSKVGGKNVVLSDCNKRLEGLHKVPCLI